MNIDYRNLLLAHTPLTDELGTVNKRPVIDFVIRPDTSALPALTLEQVSEPIAFNQVSDSGQRETRMQVDIWGETYLAVDSVHGVLQNYLHSVRNQAQGETIFIRIFEDSARDLPVTDLPDGGRVFHRAADYIIHHKGV